MTTRICSSISHSETSSAQLNQEEKNSLIVRLEACCKKVMDCVAERIRILGARAPGTMKEFLAAATLEEMKGKPSADAMLKELAANYESLIMELRCGIEAAMKVDDAGTADLLSEIVGGFEKTVWMIRSHL